MRILFISKYVLVTYLKIGKSENGFYTCMGKIELLVELFYLYIWPEKKATNNLEFSCVVYFSSIKYHLIDGSTTFGVLGQTNTEIRIPVPDF